MYAQPRLRDQNRGLLLFGSSSSDASITCAMSGRYRYAAGSYKGLKASYGRFLKVMSHVALCLSKYEAVALPSLAYSKNDFVDYSNEKSFNAPEGVCKQFQQRNAKRAADGCLVQDLLMFHRGI